MMQMRLVAVFAVLTVCANARASDAALGRVAGTVTVPGVFFVITTGARTTPPACATASNRWAVDATTSGNQAMIAQILSAQAQGLAIVVHGTGTCNVWGDSETVSVIEFPAG